MKKKFSLLILVLLTTPLLKAPKICRIFDKKDQTYKIEIDIYKSINDKDSASVLQYNFPPSSKLLSVLLLSVDRKESSKSTCETVAEFKLKKIIDKVSAIYFQEKEKIPSEKRKKIEGMLMCIYLDSQKKVVDHDYKFFTYDTTWFEYEEIEDESILNPLRTSAEELINELDPTQK